PHNLYLPSFPTRRSSDLSVFDRIPLEQGVLPWTLKVQMFSLCIHQNMKATPKPEQCTDYKGGTPLDPLPVPTVAPKPVDPSPVSDRKSTRLNSSHVAISY